MFQLKMTSADEYHALIKKSFLSSEEIVKITEYPYISLVSYCKDKLFFSKMSVIVEEQIRQIESKNIYYLLNAINLLFGLANVEDQQRFNSNLTKEPLRTAVFLAQQEKNHKMQFATFIDSACKIMLSNGGKSGIINDPIDVKLHDKLPDVIFGNAQNIGNEWYKSFVEQKLTVAKLAIQYLDEERAYAAILRSIVYSIYSFSSYKYNVYGCVDDGEALRLILKSFLNNLKR